jgi:CBS domain containing-hemolysin-like protein
MSSAGTPSNSVLASIFVLSMLLMCLVPYSLCVRPARLFARFVVGVAHWRATHRAPRARNRHRLFNRPKSKQSAVKRVSDTHSSWGRAAAAQVRASSRVAARCAPGVCLPVLLTRSRDCAGCEAP